MCCTVDSSIGLQACAPGHVLRVLIGKRDTLRLVQATFCTRANCMMAWQGLGKLC